MDATSVLTLSAPVYIICVLLKFATMAHTRSLAHSLTQTGMHDFGLRFVDMSLVYLVYCVGFSLVIYIGIHALNKL